MSGQLTRTEHLRRGSGRLTATALLVGALAALWLSTPYAVAADPTGPTLGATTTPIPAPPGDTDGDPDDWSGTPWVIAGVVVFVIAVGGLSYLRYRSLKNRDQAPM
ncbi:hypothetical protein [Kribbella sp. NPDC051770]|uniref:hypothetical protein n=1 Tax=Kribbella sp. NPDC051770 TaxID=3155413 RepID=UPI003413EB4E